MYFKKTYLKFKTFPLFKQNAGGQFILPEKVYVPSFKNIVFFYYF